MESKKVQNPNVVLTENGEVHTHEEAQVFVHDLNQFETVHVLEETRAVLSPGKLWKDHGYSHEWVSGQGPRLTKMGKILSARQTILYLLSFQGYLSIPTAVRLLLRHHQESMGPEVSPASENKAAASSSSDSVLERSDELATGKLGQESLRSDMKDENDPLADLPFWLQDFTDDLIPTEVQAPTHISQDSDSEHSTTVATKSRKHSIFSHFPKDRNCDACMRSKITKASCRRRTGKALPQTETFGDSITADHKVLNEGRESRDNHRYAVVVQDLATQWIQSYPCKTKSAHETEKSLLKFLEPSQAPKVVKTYNSMEFGKAREVLSWKQPTSAPHRSETNDIAERAVRRVKEGASEVLLQSGLDEKVVVRFY